MSILCVPQVAGAFVLMVTHCVPQVAGILTFTHCVPQVAGPSSPKTEAVPRSNGQDAKSLQRRAAKWYSCPT